MSTALYGNRTAMLACGFAVIAYQSAVTNLSALSIPTSANFASPWQRPAEVAPPVFSLRDMVTDFRDNGFPVSAIAEMANVERKTVYSWLEGGSTPRQEHVERVSQIHDVLRNAASGNYKPVYRVLNIKGSDGRTLRDVLTSAELEPSVLNAKLKELSESLARYAKIDAVRGKNSKNQGQNPLIADSPVVDLG